MTISAIHNEHGYEEVRKMLASSYDVANMHPDIQVADVDLRGDRELVLRHFIRGRQHLAEPSRDDVLHCIRRLWGYDVRLEGVDESTGETAYTLRSDTESPIAAC